MLLKIIKMKYSKILFSMLLIASSLSFQMKDVGIVDAIQTKTTESIHVQKTDPFTEQPVVVYLTNAFDDQVGPSYIMPANVKSINISTTNYTCGQYRLVATAGDVVDKRHIFTICNNP